MPGVAVIEYNNRTMSRTEQYGNSRNDLETRQHVAGSIVFSPPDKPVPLTNHYAWWKYVKETDWRHPLGPDSDLTGREKYPVFHIAYDDALAYANWAGKRIPTDAEWKFAPRKLRLFRGAKDDSTWCPAKIRRRATSRRDSGL